MLIDDIDVETGVTTKDSKLHPVGTYTMQKKLASEECGRNQGAILVFSRSRQNYDHKKLWVFKPLVEHKPLEGSAMEKLYQFFKQNFFSIKYDLAVATNEVFFGKLAASIFGKNRAPNTKFNLNERGIVSRIIGDGEIPNKDLHQFLKHLQDNGRSYFELSGNVLSSFLDAFLYACVIGNSDIHEMNMVVQYHGNGLPTPTMVYGIDHEQAGVKTGWLRGGFTVSELLSVYYRDPSEIKFALYREKFAFMHGSSFEPPRIHIPIYFKTITRDLFLRKLENIVDSLSADDFKKCYETKQNIDRKLRSYGSVYTVDEIEKIILPKIDEAIIELRRNVEAAKEFIASVNKGVFPRQPQRCIHQ